MTKIFNTKKWPKFFSKIVEKIENFPNSPSSFFKKYFFWSYQLFWKFFWWKLRRTSTLYTKSGMSCYTFSYPKSQICRPGGLKWPFLKHREPKKGKKKGKQTNYWKKNYRQKKRTISGYFAEKKSWLSDN